MKSRQPVATDVRRRTDAIAISIRLLTSMATPKNVDSRKNQPLADSMNGGTGQSSVSAMARSSSASLASSAPSLATV